MTAALLWPAWVWADPVISADGKVQVSNWDDLKTALADSSNENKTIVLTQDIVVPSDSPITEIVSGVVLDGQGFSIKGNGASGLKEQFMNVETSMENNFTIQDVTFSDFLNNQSITEGGVIYNVVDSGDIGGTFTGNSVVSDVSSVSGGAIYNTANLENIYANFSDNYAQSKENSAFGGAVFVLSGNVNLISGQFSGNYAQSEESTAYGGALHSSGVINQVSGGFSDNFVKSEIYSAGGAFYNAGTVTDIVAGFSKNYAISNGFVDGGALYNDGTIDKISGSFSENYGQANTFYVHGGAIYNNGTIDTISSDFVGNYAFSETNSAVGGAIYNQGEIYKLENASFYNNYVKTGASKDSLEGKQTLGGAIYSVSDLVIVADNDVSEFSGNKVIWSDGEDSSAIYLAGEDGNYLNLQTYNNGKIIFDDKIAALADSGIVVTGDGTGEVVFNNTLDKIVLSTISGANVQVNQGVGTFYNAIVHDKGILNINEGAKAENVLVNYDGTLNVFGNAAVDKTQVDDNGIFNVYAGGFAQNTTVNAGGQLNAQASSILNNLVAYGQSVLDIEDGALLSGNIIIDVNAQLGGTFDYSKIFKDEVDGEGSLTLVGGLNDAFTESSLINSSEAKKLHLTSGNYEVGENSNALSGWDMLAIHDSAYVKLDGDIDLSDVRKKIIIENLSTLDLSGNSPTDFTLSSSVNNDGLLQLSHSGDDADDITTIKGNYKAYENAQINIDVNPTNNTSDLLRIDGDVEGRTSVILNIVGADVAPTEIIKFVDAPNDDLSTSAYFNIYRVNASALTWNSLYQNGAWYVGTNNLIPDGSPSGYGEDNTGKLSDDENLYDDAVLPPDLPDVPVDQPSVVGEAIAYMGLPSAGIEQTKGMIDNVSKKVASTALYNYSCYGFYDCRHRKELLNNFWAAPIYYYSDVKKPFSYEAQINGFEGGFDLQSDIYNRLGLFASYRTGRYEFDGDGDEYYSNVGSEVDINSYILGLYHRYDEGYMWTMGQIFLGYQNVSIATDDGVRSDTNGIEFGASVEAALVFNPWTNLTMEPLLKLSYTQINYDDATDDYGKTATYGDVRNLEIEAGVKFESSYLYKYGYAKVYFKPSIIQNIGNGDVTVTSLRQVDGLENSTLGRIEVGGSMSFGEQLNGYASAAYTFGSDYTNAALNAGLNYAF